MKERNAVKILLIIQSILKIYGKCQFCEKETRSRLNYYVRYSAKCFQGIITVNYYSGAHYADVTYGFDYRIFCRINWRAFS